MILSLVPFMLGISLRMQSILFDLVLRYTEHQLNLNAKTFHKALKKPE